MLFLVSQASCSDPGLGSILYIVKKIITLIQIIAPLLLIIMAAIRLTMLMKDPDDKKALPKVRNAFIAAAVVFFVPVIVNAAMAMLGDSFTLSDCWNNASKPGTSSSYVDPNEGKRQKIGTTDPSQYQGGKKQVSNNSQTQE